MVSNANISDVIRTLKRAVKALPVPVVGHYTADPFTVLVSCILSLRTRDAVTHAASERLFALAKTPHTLAVLPVDQIERAIYPAAFYRVKARGLRLMCEQLLKDHDGRVPDSMEELLALPGVGRKTANLVLTLGFGKLGICVDTHVHRISNRWGYIRTRTPDESETALRAKLPKRYWKILNDLLVPYGQYICQPISPWCSRCTLQPWCGRRGVARSR